MHSFAQWIDNNNDAADDEEKLVGNWNGKEEDEEWEKNVELIDDARECMDFVWGMISKV